MLPVVPFDGSACPGRAQFRSRSSGQPAGRDAGRGARLTIIAPTVSLADRTRAHRCHSSISWSLLHVASWVSFAGCSSMDVQLSIIHRRKRRSPLPGFHPGPLRPSTGRQRESAVRSPATAVGDLGQLVAHQLAGPRPLEADRGHLPRLGSLLRCHRVQSDQPRLPAARQGAGDRAGRHV